MAKFYTPSKLSENIRETPEGFLFCLDVPIARTGYQIYGDGETPLEADENGEVEIYRSPEEVFRPQTIASFQGKAVTIKHPDDFVTPQNWKDLAKGALHNVRKAEQLGDDGEECLHADLLITDHMAIELVKAGLREVSCGYEAEYEQDGPGKGRQVNIIGNHCALVEQGRAGESYAINDHKGKVDTMSAKVIDLLKKKFGAKAVDEAMESEKKESKGEDEMGKGYDELVKAVKDLGAKVEGMMEKKSSKDEDDKPKKEESKKEEKKSEDDGEESSLEERLKALESAVAKLLEMKNEAGDEEESDKDDEDKGESEDEEESEDDDEDPTMTGDAARAEILSPGVAKKTTKGNLQKQALLGAYATKDGKTVLNHLTGGVKQFGEALKSKESVSTLFIAASEVLKHQRGTGLEKTKDGAQFEVGDSESEPMTAEKMNEINAAHWAQK